MASGFDSGFTTSDYQVKINDTTPVWVYCKQTAPPALTHCQQGMVFAINSPAFPPNTLATFHAHARDSTVQNSGSAPSSGSTSNGVAKVASSPSSPSTGGAVSDLSTVSDPSTDSSTLQRLVNYVPIMLGLLGGLILLVLGLLGLVISLVRKAGKQEKSASPKYKPIHLASAGKVDHEESESLEYQTPSGRYTDEQH
jgi:hypothetical protein